MPTRKIDLGGMQGNFDLRTVDLAKLKVLNPEPHPDYLFAVIVKALTVNGKTLNQSSILLVRAVIRDMRFMAEVHPDKVTIRKFIDKYESMLLDKTGGGGGGEDENLLQGP